MPEPLFTRLPAPERPPEYVVDPPLAPTVRATAWLETFCSARSPAPLRPPNVAAVIEPNDSVPAPFESNVLPARASDVLVVALESVSMPAETSVSPVYVFVPFTKAFEPGVVTKTGISVRFPAPVFVKARLPVIRPPNVPLVAWFTVSVFTVAPVFVT